MGRLLKKPGADTLPGKSDIRRRAEGHSALGRKSQRSLGALPNEPNKAEGSNLGRTL